MLFADQFLAGAGFEPIAAHDRAKHFLLASWVDLLRKDLAASPVIEVTNAVDYYFSTLMEKPSTLVHLLPNLAIPFERCFVEFASYGSMQTPRSGCLFAVRKLASRQDAEQVLSTDSHWHDIPIHWNDDVSSREDFIYYVTIDGVLLTKDGGIAPVLQSGFVLARNGGFAINGISTNTIGFKENFMGVPEDVVTKQMFNGLVIPACFALCLMNCKNVKVTDNEPRRTLSKRHQVQFGRPLITYKTLEIEPMKRVLENEGGIKHNGLKKALHICRGHFATYTPEKGMMGRKLEEPVTVWKPAHVRGDAAHGIAAKDYRIKAPKAA